MSKSSFDMFDVSLENIKDQSPSMIDQDLYKPSPENGRNGTYSSIVRFIPWHGDFQNPIIKKWTIFLEDPVSGKKKTVDCPSTVNDKSIFRELFFKYYNSNSVREKELSEKFKRKRNCYTLVYIIEDKNRPELEGKIMVFKFGQKILERIQDEMTPKLGGRARKPFDPMNGRPFSLVVTKKGGYANYDSSTFLDEPWPLMINGKQIDSETTEPEDIINWLKANSPDLSKYAYKKWDDQTNEFVNEAIRNIIPNGKVIDEVLSLSKSKSSNDIEEAPASKSTPKATKTSPKSLNIEEDITTESNDSDDISFDDDDDDFYSGLED